ncbi:hypothetical protein AKO1_009452 [Acrasis kona]|uniref:Squamous cell carcinoma antigen recognized by T-cells 3 n=1 Tax=Acrasis kona TaxID=1008807 RepID=A0AAW2ZLZ0_9EUKA
MHMEYIQALRRGTEITQLRAAREAASQIFPLPEQQWKQWIQDEESIAMTEEDFTRVKNLYERSFSDYQNPNIWVMYCNFIQDHFQNDTALIRETFERATQAIGAHFTLGSYIWKLYRDFEQKNNNPNHVLELYKRQLSIPLLATVDKIEDADEVNTSIWNEYNALEKNESILKEAGELYQKGLNKVSDRLQYEIPIMMNQTQQSELSKSWLTYLTFLTSEQNDDPHDVTVQHFNRAIQQLPHSDRIWKSFTTFYRKHITTDADKLLVIHNNMCRNIPWNSDAWVQLIHLMDLCGYTHEQLQQTITRALNLMSPDNPHSHSQVLLTKCTYDIKAWKNKLIPDLSSGFEYAFQYMDQYFPGANGEKSCNIERLWAHVELNFNKDQEKAISIYENVVSRWPSEASLWFNYIQFMTPCDASKVRSLYQRAVNVLENPRSRRSLAVAWAQYEREVFESSQFLMEAEEVVKDCTQLIDHEHELNHKNIVKKVDKKRSAKKNSEVRPKKKQKTKNVPAKESIKPSQVEEKPVTAPIVEQDTTKTAPTANQKKSEKPTKGPKTRPPKKGTVVKPRVELVPSSGSTLSNSDFRKLFEK